MSTGKLPTPHSALCIPFSWIALIGSLLSKSKVNQGGNPPCFEEGRRDYVVVVSFPADGVDMAPRSRAA